MISENALKVINIGVLIAMLSGLIWVIYKKKNEKSIGIILIILVYIIFQYILRVFLNKGA